MYLVKVCCKMGFKLFKDKNLLEAYPTLLGGFLTGCNHIIILVLLFNLFLVIKWFSSYVKAFSFRLYGLFLSSSLRNDSCCMYDLFLFDFSCFVHRFLVNFWFSLHVWAFSSWLSFLYQSLFLPLSLRSFVIWSKF